MIDGLMMVAIFGIIFLVLGCHVAGESKGAR